ncbi:TonB-dependent vitamin B12 receptor [Luteimonas sp. e5]
MRASAVLPPVHRACRRGPQECTMSLFSPRFRPVVLAVAIAAALPATAAIAAESDPRSLDTLVVTGTRSEQPLREALAATTVIDREQIERLQPASLLDLLRGQAGITLYNQGGPGKLSGLFLRGTGTGHVLVLVDGVKIASATAGMPMLQDIPLAQVERIEIVRGPYSSLYGAEAIGGVIQIFTRQPGEGLRGNGALTVGSHRLRALEAGIGARQQRGWFNIQAAHERSDGIDACRGRAPVGAWGSPDYVPGAGCFVDEPDRDGYRNRSLSLAGGMEFNEAWSAEARALRAEGRSQFDGGFSNETEVVQQVLGGKLRYAPTQAFALSLNLGSAQDLSDGFLDGAYVNTIDTRRRVAGVQADFATGEAGQASVGFDWQRERVHASSPLDLDSRSVRGVFGQWLGRFDAHRLQLAARHDDNSQFGGVFTGSANWGFDLSDTLRLSAGYGSAFRAPTFNDLYYPGSSNPALRPERSHTAELGLRGTPAWGLWSLNAYETRLRDLIVFNPAASSPDSPWGMPENIQRARIRGVEGSLGVDIAGWAVNATASWIDPRNTTPGAFDGNLLNRRARALARIDVDRAFGDWSVGASLNGSGHRYDDPANSVRLGGFATSDLRADWRFSPDWQLQAVVRNVFDKRYETSAWYHQPGREYALTLRYSPSAR